MTTTPTKANALAGTRALGATTPGNFTSSDRLPDGDMVSGLGRFHTNELDPAAPEKRLKKYLAIGLAGIRKLVDHPQDVDKGVAQWLIPSNLPRRCKAAQEADGEYLMLWADLDGHAPLDQVQRFIEYAARESDFELYSSKSATEEKQKSRALIPLRAPLKFPDWAICQSILNDELVRAGLPPDRSSEAASQLLYLPNRGAFYDKRSKRNGQLFNPFAAWPAEMAAKRKAIDDQTAEMERAKKAAAERRESLQFSGGTDGAMTAFNRSYSVADVLMMANYAQRGNCFRHPDSESGNYSASVKNGRVNSLSPNDPLYSNGAGARDAFDAFQVLFCDGSRDRALKLAGDEWLMIGGESWNKVQRREWAKAQKAPVVDFSALLGQIPGVAPDEAADGDSEPVQGGLDACLISNYSVDAFEPLPQVVERWIPCDEVTLLAGHGGGGKSYVALTVAVHVAMGLSFGDLATTRSKVLFYSGEDGRQVLQQRLARICRAMRIDLARLEGWLFLIDASDVDPALFRENKTGSGAHAFLSFETAMLGKLAAMAKKIDAGLVVVDNASDAFDDDEIKRARVRAFIRALRTRLARPGRAVLLLAHISKAGAIAGGKGRGGGEDYSGSTAWHNSVRSRLSLAPAPEGEDGMLISHEKANLGMKADQVRIEWVDGVPMVAGGGYASPGKELAEAMRKAAERARDEADRAALLALIEGFEKRGDPVPTAARGGYSALNHMRDEREFPKGIKDNARLTVLLRDLENGGKIFRSTVDTVGRRKKPVFTCVPPVPESAHLPDGDPADEDGEGQD